jgi:hypothetical protein
MGANHHLMEIDFLITINMEEWNSMLPPMREALIDHELEHCCRGDDDKQGNPTWYTQGHDVEDFAAVIRRHGLWSDGLRRFEAAAKQVEMSFEEGGEQPPGSEQPQGGQAQKGRPRKSDTAA